MAKIRDLKNEVNYLIFEVISDCNTFMAHHPDKRDEIVKLVEEAVDLRNGLIKNINHPTEPSKAYYKVIREQLINGADAIFKKLGNLS